MNFFAGLMLIYLSCLQIFLTAFIYLIPISNAATIVCSFFISAFFCTSGYVIHFKDIPMYLKWLKYVNPMSWLLPYLINRELSTDAIASSSVTTLCRNKQVKIFNFYFRRLFNLFGCFQIQHQDIIVQLPCPPPNGTQILANYGYLTSSNEFHNYGSTPIALIVFYCVFFVLGCVLFAVNSYRTANKRKGHNDTNKP